MKSQNITAALSILYSHSYESTCSLCPSRSNSRALKVAGVTLLAGILIAGQAFTAYMSYNHREQLNTLERRNDRLHELSRKFGQRTTILWASVNLTI